MPRSSEQPDCVFSVWSRVPVGLNRLIRPLPTPTKTSPTWKAVGAFGLRSAARTGRATRSTNAPRTARMHTGKRKRDSAREFILTLREAGYGPAQERKDETLDSLSEG